MKTNGRTWAPTMTLAKLFEEQNQFFDALAAYELISQTDASPAIRERIEDLHVRILNDPSNRYDPRIEKLFTPEELAYLKILNHNGFENMANAARKLSEGALSDEIYIDEEEEFGMEDVRDESLEELLREIEQQAQMNILSGETGFEEITVRDLVVAMLSRYDKDQPLSDVKLSDLVAVFVEMQTLKSKS